MMMINVERSQTGDQSPFGCSPSVSSWVAPAAFPPPSCSNVVASYSAAGADIDFVETPNGGGLRASSLVRKWREVGSEVSLKSQDSGTNSPRPSFSSPHSGSPKEDREQSPDPACVHCGGGGRVADIIRKLTTLGTPNNQLECELNITSDPVAFPTSVANTGEKNGAKSNGNDTGIANGEDGSLEDLLLTRTAAHCRLEEARVPEMNLEWLACNKNSPRVRGRLATMDLLSRMKDEREREIGGLENRHAVSDFSHRSRLRALLRFQILHKGDAAAKYQRPDHASTASRLISPRLGAATNPLLRERAAGSLGKSGTTEQGPPIPASTSSECHITREAVAASSAGSTIPSDDFISERDEKQDRLLMKEFSFCNEVPEISELIMPMDGSSVEAAINGIESYSSNENGGESMEGQLEEEPADRDEHGRGTWEAIFPVSRQLRWESCRLTNARYCWLESSTSDNSELQELLERKSVSTSLASEFREKMDQLIMSHLEKQEHQSGLEDDQDMQELYHSLQQKQQYYVGAEALDHAPSSFSQTSQLTELITEQDDQKSESRHSESPELELMYSLKTEISELRSWISALQKSVDNCMDMQMQLHQSINQVLSAVLHNRSV